MSVTDRLAEPNSVDHGSVPSGVVEQVPVVQRPDDRGPAAAISGLPGQPVRLIPAATLSLLATAVLIGGCAVGVAGALVAVALLQLVLVGCWSLGSEPDHRRGAAAIGLLATAASDASALRWYEHGYESALAVLGVAMAVLFAHQLTRRAPRARVVESLSSISVTLLAVCAVTGLLLMRRDGDGAIVTAGLVAAAGAALFLSYLVDAIAPLLRFDPAVDRGLLGVLFGTAGAGAAAVLVFRSVTELTQIRSGILGCALGVVVCLLSVGASFAAANADGPAATTVDTRAVKARSTAAVLWVLCLSVPVGYVLFNALSR